MTSVIHPCLVIPEILTLIFTALLQRPLLPTNPSNAPWTVAKISRDNGELETLIGLARTCKAFHGPAIDILWYYQPSLFPLIRCLPSDAYSVKQRSPMFTARCLTITRDLRETDWARIEHYAHRIRVVGKHYFHLMKLDSQVLPIIWSRRPRPGQPLLPKVRDIYLQVQDFYGSALYPRSLIGPGLQSAHLTAGNVQSPTQQLAMFDNIALALKASSSTMKAFSVAAQFIVTLDDSPNLLCLVRGFENLETLKLYGFSMTSKALSCLASFPRLQTLYIPLGDTDIPLVNAYVTGTSFPKLQVLTITGRALSICSNILEQFRFDQLESLTIEREEGLGVWDLYSFFMALHNQASHSQLKMLHLADRSDDEWLPDVSIVNERILTPLLSFINMVSIQIDFGSSFDLDNDMLKTISKAWPHLKVLAFHEQSLDWASKITLPGLLPLIANCPELENLCLLIDAASFHPSFAQLGEIIPGRKLHTLDVLTSSGKDAPAIAEFLTLTFPALRILSHRWYSEPWEDPPLTYDQRGYRACWDAVEQMMKPIMNGHA